MSMTEGYCNAIANYGASLISYIGLVDDTDAELSGSGYTRRPVTWTTASEGIVRPTSDLLFNIPAESTVAGWRGFSEETGGTNYGGSDLAPVEFSEGGQYKLLASNTGIKHELPT